MRIDILDERVIVLSSEETALVDPNFQWRTKDDRFLYPRDMRTSHLFNAFRMVWNNLNEEGFQVGKVRLYTFGAYYLQPGYFHATILNIGHELSKRHLLQSQLQELQQMAEFLGSTQNTSKQVQHDK